MQRNITLRHVAERAEVAPITVSRVLNNSGYVSESTRDRVLAAVKELNYTIHAGAQDLASGAVSSAMLAIVLPHLDNPFFVRVLEGSQAVADELGSDALIYSSRGRVENDCRALQALMRRRVAGLIYAPEFASDSNKVTELLQKMTIPIVLVDATLPGVTADAVVVDNKRAGYDATIHLILQGYERIAYIGSQLDLKQNRDRWLGYRQAIEEHDLKPLEFFVPPNLRKKDAGRQVIETLLKTNKTVDAIFAASTLITIGVFQGLKEHGVPMPEAMGLIGYGDPEWTSLLVPSLSVVSRPAEEIGQEAARLLFERIQNPDQNTEPIVITKGARMLLRESSLRSGKG